ncbi:RNase A-like domain-containing protein [Streptomyces sp. NPDC059515]|uniref:RNase A-like domain-containing protein n=1 Tax=Streptomyces sp. NPDC059515 TaxID=3346854 RepID=UPI0036CBE7BF
MIAAGLGAGGHSIDKHVGLTDDQLTQRLRDESTGAGVPTIPAASSFTDLESAQKYTQHNIRANSAEIDDWLKGNPPSPPKREFSVPSVDNGGPSAPVVTGRTAAVVNNHPTPPADAYGVSTVLKYEPSLDPPFVVLTSMPQ